VLRMGVEPPPRFRAPIGFSGPDNSTFTAGAGRERCAVMGGKVVSHVVDAGDGRGCWGLRCRRVERQRSAIVEGGLPPQGSRQSLGLRADQVAVHLTELVPDLALAPFQGLQEHLTVIRTDGPRTRATDPQAIEKSPFAHTLGQLNRDRPDRVTVNGLFVAS